MGKRVHVVKRQAQYGDTEAFNWKFEEFHEFLKIFSDDVTGESFDDNWEIPTDDFKKALVFLKRYCKTNVKNRDKLCEEFNINKENFIDALFSMEVSPTKLKETLLGFYRERDKNSNWMQFSIW